MTKCPRPYCPIFLEVNLEEGLGYEKYDNRVEKSNLRNGKTSKTVKPDIGDVTIET
jgi:hypothetical protein